MTVRRVFREAFAEAVLAGGLCAEARGACRRDRAAVMERMPAARRAALRLAVMLSVYGVHADPAAAAAQAACLKANADGQVAEGRLVTGRFRDAAGRREDAYILVLSAPVCLDGEDEMDKVEPTTRLHVYPADARLGATMRRLTGKNVRLKGNPFGQHTVHHHAPIVMQISEIDAR